MTRPAVVAVVLVFALVTAACGEGGGDPAATDPASEPTPADSAAPGGDDGRSHGLEARDGDTLVIGAVAPLTGAFAPLGAAMVAGARLAVDDVTFAGTHVDFLLEDSGSDPEGASRAVDRLLARGADVVVDASAGDVTGAVVQILSDREIPACSVGASSPTLGELDHAGHLIRTVPPVEAVAGVLADEVVADGGTRVAIVSHAGDDGDSLARVIADHLSRLGSVSEMIGYETATTDFAEVVGAVRAFGPDKIVTIDRFADGANIVRGLISAGFSPADMYGTDGLFVSSLPAELGDDHLLDGMKVVGPGGGHAFNARLGLDAGSDLLYGAGAYDCVVLLALAFERAAATDGVAISDALVGLTSGGTVCAGFADCSVLLAVGEDIDYHGQSGSLRLDEAGEPTVGRYAVAQWQFAELTQLAVVDVELAVSG